jgi:hypothetical protein
MNNKDKLAFLRIQLYTAAQTLIDEDAEEFWKLIDEMEALREMRHLRKR